MKKAILPLFLLMLVACQHQSMQPNMQPDSKTGSAVSPSAPKATNPNVSEWVPPYEMTHFDSARMPSSVANSSRLKSIFKCGKIEHSESNYFANDSGDNMYSVALDCNKDGRVNKADGYRAINIPESFVSAEYRTWLTTWKRQIVKQTKRARAKPFLCVSAEVSSDPCVSRKNVIGFNPEFSVVKK